MNKKFNFECIQRHRVELFVEGKVLCASCGAEYTISFEEDEDNFMGQDIICCPFCGDDCERPEQEEDLDKDPI